MTAPAVAVPAAVPAEAGPGVSSASPGALSHRQILAILSGLMLGLLLAALDQTIVATSIRTIADDLQGLSLQAWATTAYLITSTVTTPLYGKLSDLYGRRPLFLTAISVFIVGSVLCSISTSMYELAAFRAVQGLGAGGLMSLAFAIIGDIVPPRERARYQGYFLAVFGTSSVIGPLVGGAFAGADSILGITGWRWVFLVNVPVAAAALVVVARVLKIPHTRREHRIDWLGALALTVGLVPLLILAEQGQSWGWGSQWAIVCYAVGALGLLAFWAAERRIGQDALLPLRLFRNGVFSLTSIVSVIVGMGMFGSILVLPQYLQIVQGASPTKAGLLTLPLVGGIMVASVISGQLTSRTGRYKIFPVIGTALMTAALLIMHFRLGVDTPLWEADIYMGILGLGMGGCLQTLLLAVQNAVPARDMGVATASATFFRQMGGTIGVALFLSILFSTVTANIIAAFQAIAPTPSFQAALADPAVRANPANSPALQAVAGGSTSGNSAASGVLQDSSFLQQMDPRLARPFLIGFSESMQLVFLIAAGVIFVAFVAVLFLKEVPLRTQSGIEAQAAEDAAEAETARVATPAQTIPPIHTEPSAIDTVTPAATDGNGQVRAPAPPRRPAHRPTPAPAATVDPAVFATQPITGGPGTAEIAAGSILGSGGGDADGTPAMAVRASSSPDGPTHPVIFGQVSQRGGAAVSAASLTLADLSGEQLDRGESDTSGRYQLVPPSGGTFLVICASSTHEPRAALVAVADVSVRHDVVLSQAGASLSGTVRAAGSGQVIPGAVVTLTDVRGDVRGATTTGPDGGYEFGNLSEGDYTLTVAALALQPVAHSIQVPGEGRVSHDVQAAARARLPGRVVTARAGAPVPEALVTLVDADGTVVGSVLSGHDGGFVFDDLHIGSYTLIATGYPPVATDVHLNAAEAPETVLTLRPPVLAGEAAATGDASGSAAGNSTATGAERE